MPKLSPKKQQRLDEYRAKRNAEFINSDEWKNTICCPTVPVPSNPYPERREAFRRKVNEKTAQNIRANNKAKQACASLNERLTTVVPELNRLEEQGQIATALSYPQGLPNIAPLVIPTSSDQPDTQPAHRLLDSLTISAYQDAVDSTINGTLEPSFKQEWDKGVIASPNVIATVRSLRPVQTESVTVTKRKLQVDEHLIYSQTHLRLVRYLTFTNDSKMLLLISAHHHDVPQANLNAMIISRARVK